VDAAYNVAITWGGLRGAVTLALALAVTESGRIDASTQSLVAVLATGFVLFTLLVNGLTLRPVMRVLKLDRLSPLNKALRSKVLALALAEVRGAVAQTSRDFELAPAITESVIASLTTRREADGLDPGSDHRRLGRAHQPGTQNHSRPSRPTKRLEHRH
jgi:CPA1 family monovalent cation:H+ antiporter